jgi:hypothetical protein
MGVLAYLAANLKVEVLVLVTVALDVTTTVAVHSTPGVSPVNVTLLSAVTLELDVVKTVLLSTSLVTVIATVTPAVGIVELTLTLIACEVPTTPNIFPTPGSTFTENATGDSVGVGVGAGVVVDVSPPLLQEKKMKGIAKNNNLINFI